MGECSILRSSDIHMICDNTTRRVNGVIYNKVCGASYDIKSDWKYSCASHRLRLIAYATLDGGFRILVRYDIYRAPCLSNSRVLNGSDNGDDIFYVAVPPNG